MLSESISLARSEVAPLNLSTMCLVLLKISFLNLASVSQYKTYIFCLRTPNAVSVKGRIVDEEETSTENANDLTVSDSCVRRRPIESSSRMTAPEGFLLTFENSMVSTERLVVFQRCGLCILLTWLFNQARLLPCLHCRELKQRLSVHFLALCPNHRTLVTQISQKRQRAYSVQFE